MFTLDADARGLRLLADLRAHFGSAEETIAAVADYLFGKDVGGEWGQSDQRYTREERIEYLDAGEANDAYRACPHCGNPDPDYTGEYRGFPGNPFGELVTCQNCKGSWWEINVTVDISPNRDPEPPEEWEDAEDRFTVEELAEMRAEDGECEDDEALDCPGVNTP
jgi:hypothetical protein